MKRQDIREELINIIESDIGIRHADMQDDTGIREGLGLDSVDLVSVISQVERKFKVRLTQGDLATMTTVGQLLDLLESKLAEQSKAA